MVAVALWSGLSRFQIRVNLPVELLPSEELAYLTALNFT
jgi:hypothetical protein